MKEKDKGKGKDPILDALQQASKGLLWPSESEAPLEPFLWKDGGALTHERLLELAGAEEGTAVEETDLGSLLRTIPPEDRAKFDRLAKVLQEQLAGIKVYKV